nr:potassium channel subfamily K member 16-like isoform X2 [Equus asinus]
MYIALGAMIFQALEKDFEVERRELAVDTKCDFLKNRSNMTQEDVEVFVQMMTSLILSGIPPLGNKTNALLWTFGSSFTTSLTILSTIGYGTVFPRTPGGQMFCVVFAAIGIPLTIVFFKNIGKLVSLPFEKLGNCLKHKGISEIHLVTETGRSPPSSLSDVVLRNLENRSRWSIINDKTMSQQCQIQLILFPLSNKAQQSCPSTLSREAYKHCTRY